MTKLDSFLALSAKQQFFAFRRWVSARKPSEKFSYGDTRDCAKSRFGKVLIRGSRTRYVSTGSTLNFRWNEGQGAVQRVLGFSPELEYDLVDCKDMGQLAKVLKKYSAATALPE